jgi:hypothetical protein
VTEFADFKAQIAEWENRSDWSDALTTSFVRMAEEYFNKDLRVDWMIKQADSRIQDRCSTLPNNWLEMDMVWIANDNAADGYSPIRYKSRDEFYNLTDKNAYGTYTIVGRTIHFGGTPELTDGIAYRLAFYADVPTFSDTCPSWVYAKFPSLFLMTARMHAKLHAVGEEAVAQGYQVTVDAMIAKLNADHLRSKASGSRLTRTRTRSFG